MAVEFVSETGTVSMLSISAAERCVLSPSAGPSALQMSSSPWWYSWCCSPTKKDAFQFFLHSLHSCQFSCQVRTLTGRPQSRRKKIPEFSRLFHSHKLTFPWVFDLHINSSNITGHHRTLTSSLFLMILFTKSIAVLHNYLNDKLKILCLLQFFPEAAQNSLIFPCSEKSKSIPGFLGLWPSC